MPAAPRLRMRQVAFACRVMGSDISSTRQLAVGRVALASRIRDAVGVGDEFAADQRIEQVGIPEGLRFPGRLFGPEPCSEGEDRIARNARAVEVARQHDLDRHSLWTDGSALPGGVCAAAVVGFVEESDLGDEWKDRQVIVRRGVYERGVRKERNSRTYGEQVRSTRRSGGGRGWRVESWGLEGEATAFDAELAALVQGLEICVLDAASGVEFSIFTDSQAAITRLETDEPGPGQSEAVQGIRLAREMVKRGATVTVRWIPGYQNVLGNELADEWAVETATREKEVRDVRSRVALIPSQSESITFL